MLPRGFIFRINVNATTLQIFIIHKKFCMRMSQNRHGSNWREDMGVGGASGGCGAWPSFMSDHYRMHQRSYPLRQVLQHGAPQTSVWCGSHAGVSFEELAWLLAMRKERSKSEIREFGGEDECMKRLGVHTVQCCRASRDKRWVVCKDDLEMENSGDACGEKIRVQTDRLQVLGIVRLCADSILLLWWFLLLSESRRHLHSPDVITVICSDA